MNDALHASRNGSAAEGGAVAAQAGPFSEEVEALTWIFDTVREGRALPVIEAEAVVGSLYLHHHEGAGMRISVVPNADMPRYHAVHAVNVSLLAMTLAGETGHDAASARRIGLAAILHDIGMTRVPLEVVTKAGQISDAERDLVTMHPVEGARIIMGAGISLDLAATVAFEHHLKMDGSGYPKLLYPRTPHFASRLVQVCDVFHALMSPRPFRPAWPQEIVMSYLNERAGFEFHTALVEALAKLVSGRVIPPHSS
ncbi:MAG: HD domain-containing protein [Gemmatimonadetes bacterium]|nr:HD domain-containing protein [Gemmatimonadota bacterium]